MSNWAQAKERANPHYCHARGCRVEVPRRLLMCHRHWAMVPTAMQHRVWATYRAGQENGVKPSDEHVRAAAEAINAVAEREEAA